MEHAMQVDIKALIKRIQSGMTTSSDAEIVQTLWVMATEQNLENAAEVTGGVPYELLSQ
jgi:hypothetical protein